MNIREFIQTPVALRGCDQLLQRVFPVQSQRVFVSSLDPFSIQTPKLLMQAVMCKSTRP